MTPASTVAEPERADQKAARCHEMPASVSSTSGYWNAKMRFQSRLHVDHGPSVGRRRVQRLVEPPEMRFAVVGIFPLRIGVMDDQAEPRAAGHRRPLQHLEIAVGIAERGDRAAADMLVDADRLAGLVVDEVDFRQAGTGPAGRRASRTGS